MILGLSKFNLEKSFPLLGNVLILIIFLLGFFPNISFSNDISAFRQSLENQLQELQKQINIYQKEIEMEQGKAKTLEREINLLEKEVKKIELEMHQTELEIKNLGLILKNKEEELLNTKSKIEKEKMIIVKLIRKIYEYDQESNLEQILKNDKLSDFMEKIIQIENTQKALQVNLGEIKNLKTKLEKDKSDLKKERNEKIQLQGLQIMQESTLKNKKKEKNLLLKETKGKESLFQDLILKSHEKYQELKKQLQYLLEEIGESKSLEDIFTCAKITAQQANIRTAFLLAVLERETRLIKSGGGNLGQGNWYQDMYLCYQKLGKISWAEKQKTAFFQIAEELGLNPDTIPVSSEPTYGCGGAMGFAQFMPTTWLTVKDEVAALTGHNPPSPFNIEDAFTAAAIKLAQLGASKKDYNSEWKAAMMYFAGGNWSKPSLRWYGDKVMELAQEIQEQINNNNE